MKELVVSCGVRLAKIELVMETPEEPEPPKMFDPWLLLALAAVGVFLMAALWRLLG